MKANNTKFLIATGICILLFLGTFIGFSFIPELRYDPDRFNIKTLAGKVYITKRDDILNFRIYSNNVRVAEPESKRFTNERAWEQRKDGVINAIKANSNYSMLIGLQEVKHQPLEDVKLGLNDGHDQNYPYTHFGVGRDDGKEEGEYSAIIYNTDEWKLLNGTYKWLSETPDKPGKSWGAATNRIITFTTFEHKATGKKVNYLNTHLDQKSELARNNSADLIVNWIKEIPNDYPVFLSGDFNSLASQNAYKIINSTLSDTADIAYNKYDSDEPTYTGFESNSKQNVIDFIFAPTYSNSDVHKVSVVGHQVISNDYNGFKFSDHRPISTHIKLQPNSD